jgi:hypothetical protein
MPSVWCVVRRGSVNATYKGFEATEPNLEERNMAMNNKAMVVALGYVPLVLP